jgi:uncharacterized protein with PQ loop repeat
MIKNKQKQLNSRVLVSYLMYAVAVIMPLSNFPQIQKLYSTHVTAGLSIETWIMYLFFGFIPLAYAIVYKIKPLVVSNFLWSIVNIIMIYGIAVFSVIDAPPDYNRLLIINNVGKAIGGIGLICLSSAAAIFAYDLSESEIKLHTKLKT